MNAFAFGGTLLNDEIQVLHAPLTNTADSVKYIFDVVPERSVDVRAALKHATKIFESAQPESDVDNCCVDINKYIRFASVTENPWADKEQAYWLGHGQFEKFPKVGQCWADRPSSWSDR